MTIPVTKTTTPKPKVAETELGFGKVFTDHMFIVNYHEGSGWHDPRIVPFAPLSLSPAACVLHYGQAMFEGMKCFRLEDGKSYLFRPLDNCRRMANGAGRICMPAVPEETFMEGLHALVRLEQDWIPRTPGTALYLRPTLFATESFLGVRPAHEYFFIIICSPVGAYFGKDGLKAVRIWVETNEVRAARGGLGAVKAAANYAASLHASFSAKQRGFDQVLFLDARDHEYIEEVGTMNLFAVIGDKVVTPPLSDSILAGITRDSIITLARDMGLTVEERPIQVSELVNASRNGTLKEIFGTGTAAVVSPVGELVGDTLQLTVGDGGVGPITRKLYEEILGIQRREREDRHNWVVAV